MDLILSGKYFSSIGYLSERYFLSKLSECVCSLYRNPEDKKILICDC